MKYTGGCHCGAVRFDVDTDIPHVLACNCSICSKRGYLLTFAPEESFRLITGAEALTDYQFGEKRIHHLFCKHCGVGSFGRGTSPEGAPTFAINARCLDNIDLKKVPVREFDGKSL